MSKKKLSIAHIDDHRLFSEGIYSLLAAEKDIRWVGSAENFQTGLSIIASKRPRVVLLDYFLPDGVGSVTTSEILKNHPDTLIIILTMENSVEVMEKCKAAGAIAFLPKTIDKKELLEAIRAAEKGISTFPDLSHQQDLEDPDLIKLSKLSKREKEIALLVAKGLTSSQIAKKLYLSLLTVNTHRRNLMNKLSMNNTAQMVALISKLKPLDQIEDEEFSPE